jgi:DNA-binding LacI/PurR family transcriptional regulator
MTERSRSAGRPTIEEVAARAGVGRGTVSRVINGSPQVSPRARAAVEQAIDDLGYTPNRAARALVTHRTDSVALVVSESGERFFKEPFFGRIVQSVSSALNAAGLQLLLAIAQSPEERQRLEHYLTRQHVDGAMLLSLHGSDPLPRHLEERGVPTVRVGRPMTPEFSFCVDADNAGGARQAAEHLVRGGRRRIAAIAGPQDMAVGMARLAGFRQVVGDAGIVEFGDFSEDSGAAAMRRLLASRPDLDAVFAASDPMAAGAMRVLKESGRRIPEDVAVVGFDDSEIARHTDPALTSIHQPVEDMGRELVRLLLARIHGDEVPVAEVVLRTRLVVRDSA